MKTVQCSYIKDNGERCNRKKKVPDDFEGPWYCWQHPEGEIYTNDEFTEKQKLFCEEYLIDLNATQAAIRAGYSENTAMEQGYQLLQKTSVCERIQHLMDERHERTKIEADKVLEDIAKITSSKITDFLEIIEKNVVIGYEKDKDGDRDYTKPITQKKKVVDVKETIKMNPEAIPAISEVKKTKHGISIKLYDKLKALELLGKHLKLFADQLEVTKGKKLEDFFD